MFPFKTRRTLKRHGEELLRLPEDVVELILERLPVKSLLRFRTERQQLIHMSRGGPDVLFVSTNVYDDDGRLVKRVNDLDARRFAFGSSSAYTVHVPTNWGGTSVCHSNCDGLLCLYSIYNPSVCVVMNPATRWRQTFPLSNIQNLILHRYVHPASPFTPNPHTDPVYLDGSFTGSPIVKKNPRFCLLIFTLKLFMSSVMLPLPMFLTLGPSPSASSTIAFAFPRNTGLPKTYGPSNIPTRHGLKCVPLISPKLFHSKYGFLASCLYKSGFSF
ncbi:hypothetical protein Bca52824_054621 [Brassica carinata]|uniref:F-box domain-containing protein n=1 Tax=Brassica carinata TaxID=52824 RepID=A0A8X7UP97_BRACI|nr:hypothetical protein Bca52824_054621 [Brassica carinata]